MGAPDAVGGVAVARAEVRKSLDRLEYHLSRGAKGAKGVRREMAYLDALHRQTVRMSGVAVGKAYSTSTLDSFGRKAAESLSTADRKAIGRMKSSILADFSSDGLQPARDWTRFSSDRWVWVANGSACPTCLSKHGHTYAGAFIPSHPSCLCIAETRAEARDNLVRPLDHDEIAQTALEYGDPRYFSKIRKFQDGLINFNDLAGVENVNGQARGMQAWRRHMDKGEAWQTGLPGSAPPPPEPVSAPAPKPRPEPRPEPKPKPKPKPRPEPKPKPRPEPRPEPKPKPKPKPKPRPEPKPGAEVKYSDFGPFDSLDAGQKALKAVESDIAEWERLAALLEDQERAYRTFRLEVNRLTREAEEKASRAAMRDAPHPRTFKEIHEEWLAGTSEAPRPAFQDTLEEWRDWAAERYHGTKLGPATNAERFEKLAETSIDDALPENFAKLSKARKIEAIEDAAQSRWPLNPDGTETMFDFKGLDPTLALENIRNLEELALQFRVPAERLRYMGTFGNTDKILAADIDGMGDMRRLVWDRINGKKPRYWGSNRRKRTYAYVTKPRGIDADRTVMAINPAHMKTVEQFQGNVRRDVLMGYHPEGGDSLTFVLTHEFGHLVDYWMDDAARYYFTDTVTVEGHGGFGELARSIRSRTVTTDSKYAELNEREEWAEWFAGQWERRKAGGVKTPEWETWERFWEVTEDKSGYIGGPNLEVRRTFAANPELGKKALRDMRDLFPDDIVTRHNLD